MRVWMQGCSISVRGLNIMNNVFYYIENFMLPEESHSDSSKDRAAVFFLSDCSDFVHCVILVFCKSVHAGMRAMSKINRIGSLAQRPVICVKRPFIAAENTIRCFCDMFLNIGEVR